MNEKSEEFKEFTIKLLKNKKILLQVLGFKCSFCEKSSAFKYVYRKFDDKNDWKVIKCQEIYLCEKHKNKLLHDIEATAEIIGQPTEVNSYEYPENFTRNSAGEVMFKTKSIVNQYRKSLKIHVNWWGLTPKQRARSKGIQNALIELKRQIELAKKRNGENMEE